MTSIVLSNNPPQVFDYQHQLIQQQQIVFKKPNIPYVPPEIVRIILGLLKDDRKALAACALVNHTFNLHVTPFLYHTVSFSYPFTFNSFAKTINGESQRTRLIRHLDLSVLSTIGLQKSESDSAFHNAVTPDDLVNILRHCTMLEAFSISEHSESSINLDVLKVLALECKNLKILDFCGFSKKQTGLAIMDLTKFMGSIKCLTHFDDDGVPTYTFENIINPSLSHLKRISFHECPIINEISILTILANSPNITRLDLGGCSIGDLTLNFLATCTNIPENLTHLLLAKCKNISSEAIANLVVQCKKLEVLNLYGDRDVATAISEYDLDTILTSPSASNFKSLDIGSSRITSHILYTIQENCTSLTHLGISKAGVGLSNLTDLLKVLPNLQYIDLTGVNCLNPLNVASIINNLQKDHSLHTIEISEFLSKKLGEVNGWKPLDENHIRRSYYAKKIRPDRVHPRKLDMTETGPERMSKIFQYYSFNV